MNAAIATQRLFDAAGRLRAAATSGYLPPRLRYAWHPLVPERLGFRRALGVLNPELAKLLRTVDGFTLLTDRRRVTLYRAARDVLRRSVPGDFAEVGVHRGGSAGILAACIVGTSPERRLHLFDRWGDLPEPTQEDGCRREHYRRTRIADKLEDLRERPPLPDAREVIHRRVGFPPERTEYHEGWYQDTLVPGPAVPLAFASLDCDYYDSMVLGLDWVARSASPGARVVLDDFDGWPGVRQAAEELVHRLRGRARLVDAGTGQALLLFRADEAR